MLLGNIERSQGWQMKHEACCGIQRARQDTVLRNLGGSLTNPCILTDCLVDRLLLRARRRGFTPRTSDSSSITHRCVVFVLALFFLTLLAFILLLCYIEYDLE